MPDPEIVTPEVPVPEEAPKASPLSGFIPKTPEDVAPVEVAPEPEFEIVRPGDVDLPSKELSPDSIPPVEVAPVEDISDGVSETPAPLPEPVPEIVQDVAPAPVEELVVEPAPVPAEPPQPEAEQVFEEIAPVPEVVVPETPAPEPEVVETVPEAPVDVIAVQEAQDALEEAERVRAEEAERTRLALEAEAAAEAARLVAEEAERTRLAAVEAERVRLELEAAATKAEADRLAAAQIEADRLLAEEQERDRLAAAELARLQAALAEAQAALAAERERDRLAEEEAARKAAELAAIAPELVPEVQPQPELGPIPSVPSAPVVPIIVEVPEPAVTKPIVSEVYIAPKRRVFAVKETDDGEEPTGKLSKRDRARAESQARKEEQIERARLKRLPKEPTETEYSNVEAETKVSELLSKNDIPYLGVSVTKDEIVIDQPGETVLMKEIVKALNVPGIFGLEDPESELDVVTVTGVDDGFGNIARTVVKLDRKHAEKIYA